MIDKQRMRIVMQFGARERMSKQVGPIEHEHQGDYGRFFAEPTALTVEQIHDIVRRFATTARITKRAGFTGVEIHAAHGYLINQFLSPEDNRRTDEYGGDIEHRSRFLFEVSAAVREAVGPDFPVAVKLNSSDAPIAVKIDDRGGSFAGFDEKESTWVMKQLEKHGVDLIDISGGTLEKPVIQTNSGALEDRRRGVYFTEFARRIKGELTVPVALTGGFRNARDMERALDEGITQMIGIARPLALVPDLPKRIIRDRLDGNVDLPWVTTGVKALHRAFGGILVISWFELQMNRIGRGLRPDPRIGGLRALCFTIGKHGPAALTPRRRKGHQ